MISKIVSSQTATVGFDLTEGVYEDGDGRVVVRTTHTLTLTVVVIHGNADPAAIDAWVRTFNDIEQEVPHTW